MKYFYSNKSISADHFEEVHVLDVESDTKLKIERYDPIEEKWFNEVVDVEHVRTDVVPVKTLAELHSMNHFDKLRILEKTYNAMFYSDN